MKRDIKVGSKVTVKPTHRADLGKDPAMGIVVEQLKNGKIRILWNDGQVLAIGLNEPYMWRFNVEQ